MQQQKYDLIAISPYDFLSKGDGVRTRIWFVNRDLCENNNVLTIIRDERKKDKLDASTIKDIYRGSSNRFFHLLSIRVLYKIYKIRKYNTKVTLYCHTLRAGFYGLFCKVFFGLHYHFDDHNVEYLRFKRTNRRYRKIIRLLEKLIITHASSVSVVSKHDKMYILANLVEHKNISIIPNLAEVDTEKMLKKEEIRHTIRKGYGIQESTQVFLFFGSFGYIPNIEALNNIKNIIVPGLLKKSSNFIFIICGKGLDLYKDSNSHIIYAGFVDDVVDYIFASDMMIAPLESGSGTKLKILEALAYDLPVLTTAIGAEGIENNNVSVSTIDNFVSSLL